MNKIVKGLIIFNIVISSSLTAMTLNQETANRDAQSLFTCMIRNITPDETKTIKEYTFLSVGYSDSDLLKYLTQQAKKAAVEKGVEVGNIISSLMITCKKQTEKLFMDNSLPVVYQKIGEIAQGIGSYALKDLTDINYKNVPRFKKVEEAVEKGISQNKKFMKLIKEIFTQKMKERGKR